VHLPAASNSIGAYAQNMGRLICSVPMSSVQQQLEAAMAALESQRALLGDAVVDTALGSLRSKLASLSGPAPPEPAQTLKQVSILFLDVVGSTSLSQRLDPEEIHAVMDGALARCTAVVQAHGGKVLQYAGDNLLAVFGADEAREDDAESAVRCGLALLAEGRELGGQVRAERGHEGFNVRVGIHTGAVLLGGGVDNEGTIRGIAVNIAARMEQTAPSGALRISVDTQRQVQGLFDVAEQPALEVKGVAAPLQTFLVLGARARQARGPRHGLAGVAVPLVGRATELGQLQALAAALFAGGGLRVATVLGEAGLGKSRLLAEFQDNLPPQTRLGALWYASSHLQALHQPCGLLRDLFFWHLGVHDSDTQAQAQERFASALKPVLGAQADEHTALLGQMIGLDYSHSPHISGILQDGRQLRARGLHAWAELMRRLSAQQPLVLVLDDLQWADDESLDALDHLVRVGAALPVVMICAARLELLQRRPAWGSSWPGHRRIELTPLAARACESLAQALTQRLDPPSPPLQALLSAQTAGNPYYMEALLQMLVDTGVIRIEGERWQVQDDRLQGLQVPPTLVGVLQATLDALAAGERRCLQQASVVGAQFWDEALAAIDAQAPASLPALTLRRLALPQEQSAFEGAREYAFRHHLLHQVTYGTVLKRAKRAGHARAARWLQMRSTSRDAEVAGQIAEHFERAGVRDQAVLYWTRAAEDASRREADSAALAHADRALALDDGHDLRRSFALQRVRAGVFRRQGQTAEHLQAIAALESLAEALDDDGLRLIAARDRMWRLSAGGQNAEAVAIGEERLARVGDGWPADAARVHATMFVALSRLGRLDEASAHGQVGLEKARRAGNLLDEAALLNNIGVNHLHARRLAPAREYLLQALQAYNAAGSRHGAVIVNVNLAVIAESLCQYEQSRDELLRTLQACQEIGHRAMEGLSHANLAGLFFLLGDPRAAYDSALQGVRLGQAVADRSVQATAHGAAYRAAHALGLLPEALQHARSAQAAYRDMGQLTSAWDAHAAAASALHAAGDSAQALAEADALLAEAAQHNDWAEAIDAPTFLYRVLAPLGDARAPGLIEAAYRALNRLADTFADLVPRATILRANGLHRELCDAWDAARRSPSDQAGPPTG
jgi:class 3 adenylate cyclase